MEKADIASMTLSDLQQFCAQLGLQSFRAGQIFRWIHQKHVADFSAMSDLPAETRQVLCEKCSLSEVTIRKKLVSGIDGTVKYLYGLADGETVEAVLMKYYHGNSLCISSQVGCRMGCRFCASTLSGLVRPLSAGEMLGEVYLAEKDSGEKISSVVLMGIGEPLDNFDQVLVFLENLSSPMGKNLSLRHVSLSTCGLVDKIYRLMDKKLQLTLSVSLHAPNDEIRSKIMPVNNKYPIEQLMRACRDYFAETGRRVSFEYALIKDVNDSQSSARQLGRLLEGFPAHVNLIQINPVKERDFQRAPTARLSRFKNILEENRIAVTVRRELGSDINAACGQLRIEEKGEGLC